MESKLWHKASLAVEGSRSSVRAHSKSIVLVNMDTVADFEYLLALMQVCHQIVVLRQDLDAVVVVVAGVDAAIVAVVVVIFVVAFVVAALFVVAFVVVALVAVAFVVGHRQPFAFHLLVSVDTVNSNNSIHKTSSGDESSSSQEAVGIFLLVADRMPLDRAWYMVAGKLVGIFLRHMAIHIHLLQLLPLLPRLLPHHRLRQHLLRLFYCWLLVVIAFFLLLRLVLGL